MLDHSVLDARNQMLAQAVKANEHAQQAFDLQVVQLCAHISTNRATMLDEATSSAKSANIVEAADRILLRYLNSIAEEQKP